MLAIGFVGECQHDWELCFELIKGQTFIFGKHHELESQV